MWDKPGLLNTVADALFAIAVLLVVVAAAVYTARLPQFALREVRVAGDLRHVTREQVEDVVKREVKGGFFTVNLGAARAAFERLPWVRGANVRREWPARLDVVLEEHLPLARWGTEALVNTQGEVFHAAYDGELPVFVGPEGSAREIAIQYRYFKRSLATIGQAPVQVQVNARRAWQLRLRDGLTLELGREDIEARLARFVALHDRTIGRLDRRIDYVDLRYANGFAVRVPELRHEKADPKRARRTG
jgi:cell division protein FtsQ